MAPDLRAARTQGVPGKLVNGASQRSEAKMQVS
jgi:hypothetical protein